MGNAEDKPVSELTLEEELELVKNYFRKNLKRINNDLQIKQFLMISDITHFTAILVVLMRTKLPQTEKQQFLEIAAKKVKLMIETHKEIGTLLQFATEYVKMKEPKIDNAPAEKNSAKQ